MGGRGSSSYKFIISSYKHKHTNSRLSAEEVAEYLGLSPEEASAAYDAVYRYTDSDYTEMRKSQIDGKPSEDAELVEKFIKHAPQWDGGTTYRGVGLSEAALGEIKVGAEVEPSQRALGSWSKSLEIAQDFAGMKPNRKRVVFVSKTQKHATSIAKFSDFPHEEEVLVSSQTRYRVTKIKKQLGTYYVHVDVL